MAQFLPPLTPLTKLMSHCNSRVVTEHRRTSELACQQCIYSIVGAHVHQSPPVKCLKVIDSFVHRERERERASSERHRQESLGLVIGLMISNSVSFLVPSVHFIFKGR